MGESEERCAKSGEMALYDVRNVLIGCPCCACRRLESFEEMGRREVRVVIGWITCPSGLECVKRLMCCDNTG